jgi:hypothetical protein
VTNDVDTLAAALYVKTDDLLKQAPHLAPWRPKTGIEPRLTDAELVTLAVMQALLGYTSESGWLRQRLRPSGAPVPLPAPAARVQQATACRRRADQDGHPGAGRLIWSGMVDAHRPGSWSACCNASWR